MDPWGQVYLFCLMRTVDGTCDFISRPWNFNSVDGRRITAARWIRRGSRNSDQKPNRNRSSVERLGARRRERLMTRSCCFMSRLSATTALAPPVPRSLAMVVNRWMRSISRSFMAEQGREGSFQEQVCLSCRFQVIITNSPRTPSTLHPGDRHQGVLLRSAKPVAAGFQREHEWSAQTVFSQRHGLVSTLAGKAECGGASAKRATAKDAGFSNPGRTI